MELQHYKRSCYMLAAALAFSSCLSIYLYKRPESFCEKVEAKYQTILRAGEDLDPISEGPDASMDGGP